MLIVEKPLKRPKYIHLLGLTVAVFGYLIHQASTIPFAAIFTLVERQDQHAAEMSNYRNEMNAMVQEAEQSQEKLRAYYEDMLSAQRVEHAQALRDLQQQCTNADRRSLEMEKELRQVREELEQDRRRVESQRRRYEQRIKDLERQDRNWEATTEKAEIAQHKSSYCSQNQEKAQCHDNLDADCQEAYEKYQQCHAAWIGHVGVINILNMHINDSG